MQASELRHASRERLMHDLDSVATDVEQMLSATAAEAGEAYDAAMLRMKNATGAARARLRDAEQRAVANTRSAALATDAYVHDNAWKMVVLAAAAGLLAGMLLARR
jgi:ElaB/YqjD/DUF883 family membrane-anchored ribosome-binding protein